MDDGEERRLSVLPDATSMDPSIKSNARITQMMEHANRHVEKAMRKQEQENEGQYLGDFCLLEEEARRGSKMRALRNSMQKKARGLLGKLGVKHPGEAAEMENDRYNRLKQESEMMETQLKQAEMHRTNFQSALEHLATNSEAMHDLGVANSATFMDRYKSANYLITDLVTRLDMNVAPETRDKIHHVKELKRWIGYRQELKLQMEEARKDLARMQRFKGLKVGEFQRKEASQREKFHALRRRLHALTDVLEEIFQFNAQLKSCVVDPELAVIRNEVNALFTALCGLWPEVAHVRVDDN